MQFERNEFHKNRKKRFEKMAMSSEKKKKNYESLTVDNREENKLEAWQRDSILWSAVNNKERKAKMD